MKEHIKKYNDQIESVIESKRKDREYFLKQNYKERLQNLLNTDNLNRHLAIMELIKDAYNKGKNRMDCNWSDFYDDFVHKTKEKAKSFMNELDKHLSGPY